MSAAIHVQKSWIKNPATDLTFFDFGWFLILFPLVIFKEHLGIIILSVLIVNYIHRHYTFALVYGDKEEFQKRKQVYMFLPIIAALATVLSLYLDAFKVLLVAAILWNMYHTITQKYGITRIYSRKAGYGEAWIEKGLIYSWFLYIIFALAVREKEVINQYQADRVGDYFQRISELKIGYNTVIFDYIGDYISYITLASYFFFGIAIAFTLLFAYQEFKNRHQISKAKILFVISILMLYSIFFYSLIVGYMVFAFSHALEYIAFVNIFVNSKYKRKPDSRSVVALASKKQWLYSSLFSLGIVAICLLGMKLNENAFAIYIVGSSFLHFIYDGLIWKVRRPEVGKPLDIKYA
jgi:hypothetical protein